ncbi:alanine aminotransferase, putative, partial [Ixodes scapularis]
GLCCGYFEIVNLNKKDKAKLLKAGAEVKASSLAQVALDCLVKPPKPGEPSYDIYREEKRMTLEALKEKAELVHDRLNSIEGFYCSPLQGAMAAFPRVSLPQRAIDKAK